MFQLEKKIKITKFGLHNFKTVFELPYFRNAHELVLCNALIITQMISLLFVSGFWSDFICQSANQQVE